MSREVEDLIHSKLCNVLMRHIEPIFKAGTKFAIIARTPGNDEADVLVTDDGIDNLIALLQRSKTRGAIGGQAGEGGGK